MPRPNITALPDSVFELDRGGPVPIYRELAARLEAAILAGELAPGARLDQEAALSEQLGVSRPTVSRAIHELVGKGLLVRRRGIGTQVVPNRALNRKLELSSLWDDLTRLGKAPTTTVVHYGAVTASAETAGLLGVNAGSKLLHIRRVRHANGVPLAILENYLPAKFLDLTDDELERRGLYESLARRGVVVQVGHQSITAVAATNSDAQLLDLSVGAPLLAMTRTAFDAGGVAVETGTHLYRPDLYAFEATLVRS